MYYFKFQIPTNEDGSVATYSQGWCGTRDKCALNEKGILYHDKERWGIGQAEGDYVPDDVEVLTKEEVINLVKSKEWIGVQLNDKLVTEDGYIAKGSTIDMVLENVEVDIVDGVLTFTSNKEPKEVSLGDEVYHGQKLADRYLPKAEIFPEFSVSDEVKAQLESEQPDVVSTNYVTCPTCHKVVFIMKKFTNGSISLFSLDTGKTVLSGIIAKTINVTCPSGHKITVSGGE